MSAFDIPPGTVCQACHLRPATDVYGESVFAVNHGMYEHICHLCLLNRQVAHAEQAASRLDDLRAQRDLFAQQLAREEQA